MYREVSRIIFDIDVEVNSTAGISADDLKQLADKVRKEAAACVGVRYPVLDVHAHVRAQLVSSTNTIAP